MFQRVAVGQQAPDFELEAVQEEEFVTINLKSFKGKYVVLLFYNRDFTKVCESELKLFSDRINEFKSANCQLLAISTDSKYTHLAWTGRWGMGPLQIPLLSDHTHTTARTYEVLNVDGHSESALFIIDSDGILRVSIVQDSRIERSVDETLRLLKKLQKSG
ncbi:Thioredoxin peroxidase [Aphelenchoides besseyi]|nr:Thioredoxin peroxidase [Aphelenchoides besseyi]